MAEWKRKLNQTWSDKWQTVNWRALAYLSIIPIIIFYSIAMAGCLPGLSNIYLVKFKSPDMNSITAPEIRVGYFGICAGDSSNMVCLSSQGTSASALVFKFTQFSARLPPNVDSIGLIQFCMTLQTRIFPPIIAGSGVIFAAGIVALGLFKFNLRKDNRAGLRQTEFLRKTSILLFWVASMLALASTLTVAQTSAGIQFATRGTAQFVSNFNDTDPNSFDSSANPIIGTIESGPGQQVLQWLVVVCLSGFTAGASAMHTSSFIEVGVDFPRGGPEPFVMLTRSSPPLPSMPSPGVQPSSMPSSPGIPPPESPPLPRSPSPPGSPPPGSPPLPRSPSPPGSPPPGSPPLPRSPSPPGSPPPGSPPLPRSPSPPGSPPPGSPPPGSPPPLDTPPPPGTPPPRSPPLSPPPHPE